MKAKESNNVASAIATGLNDDSVIPRIILRHIGYFQLRHI